MSAFAMTNDSRIEVSGKTSPTEEERKWAAYAHQTLCWMFLIYLWFGALVATTVLMEVFKSRSRFVVFHARQTLFLQLGIIVMVGPAWLTSKFCKMEELDRLVQILIGVPAILGLLLCVTATFASLTAVSQIRAGEGQDFEYWLVGRWAREADERQGVRLPSDETP